MGTKREVSWQEWQFDEKANVPPSVGHSEMRPATAMQALMEADFGQEPALSLEELAPLRELIDDAIQNLTERERWVFEGLFCRRMSQRQIGRELSLSKTQVVRIRDTAIDALQTALMAHEEIREYLR